MTASRPEIVLSFVSICVPSRMRARPRVTESKRFFEVAAARITSRVAAHEHCGRKQLFNASSDPSVPSPTGASSLEQRGQAKGSGSSAP